MGEGGGEKEEGGKSTEVDSLFSGCAYVCGGEGVLETSELN